MFIGIGVFSNACFPEVLSHSKFQRCAMTNTRRCRPCICMNKHALMVVHVYVVGLCNL